MKKILLIILITLLPLEVFAKCQIPPAFKKEAPVSGNAGCLIKIAGRMVMINEGGQGYAMPGGGAKKWHGKMETARQTACRETDEEVFHSEKYPSVTVTIGKLYDDFDGNFYLFECSVDPKAAEILKGMAPYTIVDGDRGGKNKIEVVLEKPSRLKEQSWRFPKQRRQITKFFEGE